MAEPIRASESDEVGNKKSMSTNATLFTNGLLSIETQSKSRHSTEGLRGHVLVICIDGAGRAIWVSQDHRCTTRCSTLDFTCSSSGTDGFQEMFPAAVGEHTRSLDIVHSEEGLGNFRGNVINGIKAAGEIADAVKRELDKLQ